MLTFLKTRSKGLINGLVFLFVCLCGIVLVPAVDSWSKAASAVVFGIMLAAYFPALFALGYYNARSDKCDKWRDAFVSGAIPAIPILLSGILLLSGIINYDAFDRSSGADGKGGGFLAVILVLFVLPAPLAAGFGGVFSRLYFKRKDP